MSFRRHARSIAPMLLGESAAYDGGGTSLSEFPARLRSDRSAIRIALLLIVRDESHRLSPGGLVSTSGIPDGIVWTKRKGTELPNAAV